MMQLPQGELMNIANQLNTASAMHKAQANRIRSLMGETNSPVSSTAIYPFAGFTLLIGLFTVMGAVNLLQRN